MKNKKDAILRKFMIGAFILYLGLLFYFLFFAESTGRTIPGASYRYNLTLFQEIGRFWIYRDLIGFKTAMLNLGGNMIGFMPFGFILPFLDNRCKSIYKIIVWSFLLSLAIELTQLLTKTGCCDVDDMLLNTIGGTLGYIAFRIGGWIRRKKNDRETP